VEVHPHAIRTELVKSPAVREYQVHQTERGAHIAVVAEGELDPDALATAVARSLRRAGVPDPHITVRRVGAIPCHPQTGKVTRFIALMRA
jgi:phenylacetate-coenzyme A ligase PaaK-like adenylate-forming protein